MLKTVLFLVTLFSFLLMDNLNATTYYVDNAGNDGNPGTSQSAAWHSLSKVNSYGFSSGDVVSFKCGQRFSDATLSGKSNITFNSYGSGARPVIDGQKVRLSISFSGQTNVIFNGIKFVNGLDNGMYLYNCTYFTFESCNIDSGYASTYSSSAKATLLVENGNHLTIRNSTISYGYNTHGIYINGCSNTLLEHDTIGYNRAAGVNIGYSPASPYLADGITIRYSVIKQNGDAAVYDDGCQNSQFYYNIIEGSTSIQYNCLVYISENALYNEHGIAPNHNSWYNNTFILHDTPGDNQAIDVGGGQSVISHLTNMTFKNNIFYIEGGDYAWLFRGTPANSWTITNNDYYAPAGSAHLYYLNGSSYSSLSAWKSATGYEANSQASNPLFNTSAYTLQSSSPCINSGTLVGLTTDMAGNTISGNPDLGAFESGSGGGGGGGGTIAPSTLNLTVLIEALYVAGGTSMPISPMVKVELHNSTSPYALVDSNSTVLNQTGTGTFNFTKAVNGTGYYIVVKYMNALATWSASPQSFTSSSLSYNFTTAVTQAYTDGSNPPLALHNGKYCIYSGDLNQDGVVNKSDYTGVDSDNSTFNFHTVNDLTGDGLVSSADEQFIDNNFIKSIHRQAPAGAL
jgi:hypothetical protein